MEFITAKMIEDLNLNSKEMLEWVDEALRHKRQSTLPAKTSMKFAAGGGFYNVMPCIIPQMDVAGLKLVNRYPQRNPSLKSEILLYDFQTGGEKIHALMDADFITTYRTACVAVHSLKLFAKKNYRIVSIIGLGAVGKAFLKIFLENYSFPGLIIRIFNHHNCAEKIIEQFKNFKQVSFEKYDDYYQMVKDSDVVVSAVTFAENDFAQPDIYKKGVLIIPIHTRGFMECDKVFDKVFADDIDHVKGFKYFDKIKCINEIVDVCEHKTSGRDTDDQRILVYNIGIALHDLYFARKIYSKLQEKQN